MIIETLYNITFSTKRNGTPVSATALTTATTIVSSARGVLRPINDVAKLFNADNFGKEFSLKCAVLDIKPNDLIYINSIAYGALGVSMFEDLEDDSETHLECRIVKKNQ